MDNSERLIVVTGGTKGIGKAIIERFSQDGWTIATCSRSEKDLNELKSEVKEKFGNSIRCFRADLSKKDQVRSFAEFVGMIAKPVEILINNSGTFIPGLVHLEPEGALENMIETNLYSAYNLSRAIIPGMKKKKSGHIFNLCSVASLQAYPNGGSYSISKFALQGMSKALREEMKEFGIRVTSVMPGAVLTPSWEGVDFPKERFIKPEDIAEIIYSTFQLSKRSVVEDIVIRPQLGDI
jgi:short-subunit dehydrogenase